LDWSLRLLNVEQSQANHGLDLFLELGETRPARALETALRDAIVAGRLPVGHRLPPTRSLAADLGIARATVSDVYGQLTAEGWLEARVGAGTWVTDSAVTGQPAAEAVPGAVRVRQAAGTEVTRMYGGVPDPSRFPRREWLAAARRAVDSATVAELGYPDPRGAARLRRELAVYLTRTRGVQADPELTLVGHGFGSLLSLVCRTLAAGGARRIAVEEYGHAEHRDIASAAGLEVIPLPVDRDGADVTGTPPPSRLGAADAVLLTASHQFPLGVPLSPQRRRQVVNWARASGGIVLEDDYDGEFRFDRRSVGALQGMAPDHVVYLGTASKALAPAIGLAWAVVPGRLLAQTLRQRALLDRAGDTLNQLTLAEFFAGHAYDRQVRRMRSEYRQRRELLVAELAARVPHATVMGVAAGLQATIGLPDGTDPEQVVAQGLRRGLEFLSLSDYAADAAREGAFPRPPAIVLGYGAVTASRARANIKLAVAAIAAGVSG
jgi:GntR family transcriptional regulator/MocR family aminotransferase